MNLKKVSTSYCSSAKSSSPLNAMERVYRIRATLMLLLLFCAVSIDKFCNPQFCFCLKLFGCCLYITLALCRKSCSNNTLELRCVIVYVVCCDAPYKIC